MCRIAVCLIIHVSVAGSACGQQVGLPVPWPERTRPPQSMVEILDELAAPEVSGHQLSAEADGLLQAWEKHLGEREQMASLLAGLAAAFEKEAEFVKALVLYDLLWVEFPERQDLIGKIKRKHALDDVPIDLSTPEKAFLSLKRALLTYKLTAPTFGITGLDTAIYERSPIERHEWEACKREYKREFEALVREALEGEHGEDTAATDVQVVPRFCRKRVVSRLEDVPVTIDFKDTPYLEAIERVSELLGVPLVLKPEARCAVADKRVTLALDDTLLKYALRYLLRYQNLKYVVRNFSLFIEETSRAPEERFLSVVIQQEPITHFPDDVQARSGEEALSRIKFLLFPGSDGEIPKDWFVHVDDGLRLDVVTAPAGMVGQWCAAYSTAETGRYYGRVLPLFRCLRRYPLPGPLVNRDVGHPKKLYIFCVQLRCQVQGMQALLDDREAVAGLLGTQLDGVVEHESNRFEPHFLLEASLPLVSRLGLWFDGKAYRFLLFDTEQDRDRWLKGEDWVDMPSDLDNYDWPTEEEWEKQLEEERKEAERLVEEGVWRSEDALGDEAEDTDEE